MKKALRNGIIALIALLCIGYPIYIMIIRPGFFQWHMAQPGYHKMIVELLVWFLLAMIGIRWRNVNWLFLLGAAFAYLHMMALPMLAAGVYSVLTVLLGYFVSSSFFSYDGKGRYLFSFFLGMQLLTISYALLSLVHLGGIRNLWVFDGVLLVLLLVWYLRKEKPSVKRWYKKGIVSYNAYMKLTAVLGFVMLTVGRANVSCDVDSVWYGLRSAFVLDNKTGIYENLKLVGCVYTYPKGYEVYALPLSGFPSYGFVYAGNIVLALLILYVAYRICRLYLERDKALWGMVLVAAIPGIMNMAITSKADIVTLFIQLLEIYFAMLFLRQQKGIYLGMVAATYIYAQSLKPTAVIFSTTIVLALACILLVYRIRPAFGRKSVWLTVLSLVDLAFIWLRTYLLTGIPATSVWGKFFRLLGMTDKYPYASGQISQFRVEPLFSPEVIKATLTRMKEIFLAPNSPDTDHIVLAWGSTLCTFLFVLAVVGGLFQIKKTIAGIKKNPLGTFLGLLILGEFAGCVLSLWTLSKPDGNYFMLYYSVTVIVSVIFVQKALVSKEIVNRYVLTAIFCLFVPVNLLFSGATTWAWTSNFSEINWINKGYCNHRGQFKKVMYDAGCRKIYNTLAADRSHKVFAFGTHPDVEQFPCVIESEQDVSFWGNAELTASPENYIRFVKYEAYDYIYVQPDYIQKDSGAYQNICALFDQNMIAELQVENGHLLLTLGECKDSEKNAEMKARFVQHCPKTE